MRILVCCNHYAVCSGRFAAGAFTRLGHDVRHSGPALGRDIWGLRLPERYAWSPQPLDGFAPDLVVVMDSDPALLDAAAAFDAPVVVWGVDNHVRRYYRSYFDHYFLAHYHGPAHPVQRRDETWLPCAYDPTLHTPSPIPFEAREYDVALVGVLYPQRAALVEPLRAAGLKVLAGTGLVYDEYVEAYHNARISLCVSARGDVAQRVFETAAMGCVVMSDPCADFALLRPMGVWVYDPATLVDEVRAVLANPRQARTLIEAARSWVRPHTWDARAQLLLDSMRDRLEMRIIEK